MIVEKTDKKTGLKIFFKNLVLQRELSPSIFSSFLKVAVNRLSYTKSTLAILIDKFQLDSEQMNDFVSKLAFLADMLAIKTLRKSITSMKSSGVPITLEYPNFSLAMFGSNVLLLLKWQTCSHNCFQNREWVSTYLSKLCSNSRGKMKLLSNESEITDELLLSFVCSRSDSLPALLLTRPKENEKLQVFCKSLLDFEENISLVMKRVYMDTSRQIRAFALSASRNRPVPPINAPRVMEYENVRDG